jgi:hypothetical protein
MRRREVIIGLLGGVASWPLGSAAQTLSKSVFEKRSV